MNRGFRQAVIDEYLEATSRNEFVPDEFLTWLEPKNNHRVWGLFYGKSDAEAAHEFRLYKLRAFTSGLRIRVVTTEVETRVVKGVSVERPVVVQVPAFVSPRAGRKEGGGYIAVKPGETESMAELYGQGADDLERWLSRYEGAARLAGADVTGIKEVVEILRRAAEPGARVAG